MTGIWLRIGPVDLRPVCLLSPDGGTTVSSGDGSPPLDDPEIDIIGGNTLVEEIPRTVKILSAEINREYLMLHHERASTPYVHD